MKILIAEDEKDLSRVLSMALSHEGYQVVLADNGLEAVEHAKEESFDCMIFDIMMPIMDGIEALSTIRKSGNTTPVIFLTAKTEIEDRVLGLDVGADDYLTKPFSIKELSARIRALTRRKFSPTKLTIGSVCLDTEILELSSKNSIRLAKKESMLMEYLMLNPNKELSTKDIYDHIWAKDDISEEVVYIYISYLRQKINAVHGDIQIIGEKDGTYMLKQVIT